MPCIFESSLPLLSESIEQIQTAMGTGKVISKWDQSLYEVPRRGEFETPAYCAAMSSLSKLLVALQYETGCLTREIVALSGERDIVLHLHMEFFLVRAISSNINRTKFLELIEYMDRIDLLRNAVCEMFHLNKIPISSQLLRDSETMREYDWGNFYLRCHAQINAFLRAPEKQPGLAPPG